jgi:hypothetical protein
MLALVLTRLDRLSEAAGSISHSRSYYETVSLIDLFFI